MKRQLIVGLLFAIGIAGLAFVTIVLTDWAPRGFTFQVQFQTVSGLEKEKPVIYHGFKIGKVKKIEWVKDGSLLVTVRLTERVPIPSDAMFTVDDATFFGGKQLTIRDRGGAPTPDIERLIRQARQVDLRPDQQKPLGDVARRITELTGLFVDIQPGFDDVLVDGPATPLPIRDTLREMLAGTKDPHLTFYFFSGGIAIRSALDPEKMDDPLRGEGEKKGVLETVNEVAAEVEEIVQSSRDDFLSTMRSLRESLDAIAEGEGTFGKLIHEDGVYQDLEGLLENLNRLSGSLSDEEMLEEVKAAVRSLKAILESAEKADVGATIRELREAGEEVARTLKQVNEGPGTVHRLIYDDTLVSDIERISGRLVRGEGTLGKLLTEDDLYVSASEAVDTINEILAQATSTRSTIGRVLESDELYETAKEALESLDQASDDISATLGVAARTWLAMGISYRQSVRQEMGIGKIYFRLIPRESRYFLVGGSWLNPTGDSGSPIIFDEQDQDEGKTLAGVDVQVAQLFFINREDLNEWNDVVITLRAGLLEGKAGGGIDVDFLQSFRWTFEIRDTHRDPGFLDEQIDTVMLRTEASVRLWRYFRLYAGADNLGEHPGFVFGGQVEWFDEDIKGLIGLLATAF